MSLAVGDAARQEDGTLGVVCYVLDHSGNVNLLLEDGLTTGYIKLSRTECIDKTRCEDNSLRRRAGPSRNRGQCLRYDSTWVQSRTCWELRHKEMFTALANLRQALRVA
jgi:hypothetical protein